MPGLGVHQLRLSKSHIYFELLEALQSEATSPKVYLAQHSTSCLPFPLFLSEFLSLEMSEDPPQCFSCKTSLCFSTSLVAGNRNCISIPISWTKQVKPFLFYAVFCCIHHGGSREGHLLPALSLFCACFNFSFFFLEMPIYSKGFRLATLETEVIFVPRVGTTWWSAQKATHANAYIHKPSCPTRALDRPLLSTCPLYRDYRQGHQLWWWLL